MSVELNVWEKGLVAVLGIGALGSTVMAVESFTQWQSGDAIKFWLDKSPAGKTLIYNGPYPEKQAHLDLMDTTPKGHKFKAASVTVKGTNYFFVEALSAQDMGDIMAHIRTVCSITGVNAPINTQGTQVGMVVQVADESCIRTKP